MFSLNNKTALLALGIAVLVTACDRTADHGHDHDHDHDGHDHGGHESSPTEGSTDSAALPADFFLADAPAAAVTVATARATVATGQDVVLTGYIGGRPKPFTEGRALFVMADMEKAPACTDGCPVAWDACCVPGDVIAANSVTVQVAGADGMPLKLDLQGRNGLNPGAQVAVMGTVREANPSLMIVDARNVVILAQAAP